MPHQCTSCGAAVDIPEDVLATSCTFCDSPLVATSTHAAPVDRVVPFVVTRRQATTLLRKHLQSAWLAPESLRRSARPRDLRSVLVPFYRYEALARTRWSASVGVNWQRTETYTTTDSNGTTQVHTRTVTETEWFPLSGTHARVWHDHLVSASEGLDEAEANELEPFDLGRSRPWAPAHVAGLAAEHPTIPPQRARSTAAAELQAAEKAQIAAEFLPGDAHRSLEVSTQVDLRSVELVLMPVWLAVAGQGEEAVRMLVNGQTGEVVADLPRSKAKIALFVVLLLAFVAALFGLFTSLGG